MRSAFAPHALCFKAKDRNFNTSGLLRPNPISSRPYESVSMDFIVNLPWLDGHNEIPVVVDRLTKHAQLISPEMGLNAEGFTNFFAIRRSGQHRHRQRPAMDFAVFESRGHLYQDDDDFLLDTPPSTQRPEIVNKGLEIMLRA